MENLEPIQSNEASNEISFKSTKPGLEDVLNELRNAQVSDSQDSSPQPSEQRLLSAFDRCFNKFDRCFNKFDRCFNKFDRN